MPVAIFDGLRDPDGDGQATEPRLQIMVGILVISLFAVSFPELSKIIPFLRIPRVVFFIGKHFGTGVILATAFIHLLQDSFEALQKTIVKEHFHHVGKYTGLIILTSLLSIFLVEYLSTTYVDHLHAERSLPPTPVPSRTPSPQGSRRHVVVSSLTPAQNLAVESVTRAHSIPGPPTQQTSANNGLAQRTDEATPLLRPSRTQSTPHAVPHHMQANHPHHHALLPTIVTHDTVGVVPIEVLTNSPRIIKMRGCTCVVGHACACPASALGTHPHTPLSKDSTSTRDPSRSRQNFVVSITERGSDVRQPDRGRVSSSKGKEDESGSRPSIGRKRQVIGLLVLQLGIMIHSIVIGLTLAITTGADFTSLTTAVIFHQLFEGLSLGIRIAALPPPLLNEKENDTTGCKARADTDGGFWKNTLILFGGKHGEGWLKWVLAILFAITTPAGMGIGMIAFKVGKRKEGIELARMFLIQGIMSAISAGMLIYVSTVEMIAGDFVFGDVEGHSHHGHGHTHELPSFQDEESAPTTPDHMASRSNNSSLSHNDLANESVQEDEGTPTMVDDHYHQHHHHHHHHHGKISKKVLAILSLLAGVGGMVLVGLGE